jgi:hypothetical protein
MGHKDFKYLHPQAIGDKAKWQDEMLDVWGKKHFKEENW